MAGTRYPKSFLWTGWHPQCRCRMVPITISKDDFKERVKARHRDKLDEWHPKEQTTEMPKAFTDWVEANQHRWQQKGKVAPFFIRDNYQQGDSTKGLDHRITAELEAARLAAEQAAATPQPITDYDNEVQELRSVATKYDLDLALIEQLRAEGEDKKALRKEIDKQQKLWHDREEGLKAAINDAQAKLAEVTAEWNALDIDVRNEIDKTLGVITRLQKQEDKINIAKKPDKQYLKAQSVASLAEYELKKLQAEIDSEAEKALADIIPDVHKWHQQFTIAELQQVKDAAQQTLLNKAYKYYIPDWDSMPLDEKKAILEDEIKYVTNPNYLKPHKLYPTSQVMESVYQKELKAVNEAIAWKAIETNLAAIKAYSVANPTSSKIATLVAEAEAIKANGGSIAEVEAKIKAAEKVKAINEANKASKAQQQVAKNAVKIAQLQADKSALDAKKAAIETQIASTKDKALLKQYKADLKDVQKQIDKLDKQIDKLGGGSPFTADAYSQARKNAAFYEKHGNNIRVDNEFRNETEMIWAILSPSEKEALTAYTEGSGHMNRPLRGYDGSWYNFKGIGKVDWNREGGRQHIMDATSAIAKVKAKEDMWLVRGWETKAGVEAFLGMPYSKIIRMTQAELDTNFLGKVITDEGFVSCGTMRGTGFSGALIGNIYCPKGTQLIYAEPFSYFNGDSLNSKTNLWNGIDKFKLANEFETIIQRGSKYRVCKIYIDKGQLYADFEVVGQI